MPTSSLKFTVSPEEAGLRLDRFVSSHSAELSRTRVQELIEAGLGVLNGKPSKESHKGLGYYAVGGPPPPPPPVKAEGRAIPPGHLFAENRRVSGKNGAG